MEGWLGMLRKIVLLIVLIVNPGLAQDESNGQCELARIFSVASLALRKIEKKGDEASMHALADFYKNLKDVNYKIDWSASRQILSCARLVDHEYNVHLVIREAFRTHLSRARL